MTSFQSASSLAGKSSVDALRQRFNAIVREIDGGPAPETLSAPTPADPPASQPSHASAWDEAVHVGALRERLRECRTDASVRAIAREVGSSSGRIGELLQIREAFPDKSVPMIGLLADEGDPLRDLAETGAAQLSRLSYRALRSASQVPGFYARIGEVRRLVQTLDRVVRSTEIGASEPRPRRGS